MIPLRVIQYNATRALKDGFGNFFACFHEKLMMNQNAKSSLYCIFQPCLQVA